MAGVALRSSSEGGENTQKTDDDPNTTPGHVQAKWSLTNQRTTMEPPGSTRIW